MALADNLTAAWELDEASGSAIDSHASNDLAETSGTIGTGTGIVYGTARDFERDDTEYFGLADNTDLSTGDIDFTLEAWIKLETVGAKEMILCKEDGFSGEYYLFVSAGGIVSFQVFAAAGFSGGTTVTATTEGALSTGVWYHVVCWHDAAGNAMGVAVDAGTADTASYSGGVYDGTGGFALGIEVAAGALVNAYDGLLGPVRLWKRVLTSGERTELYNAGAGMTYAAITGGGAATATVGKFLLLGVGG